MEASLTVDRHRKLRIAVPRELYRLFERRAALVEHCDKGAAKISIHRSLAP